MTLSYNLAHQETILVHPTRRQIFAGKPYPTFYNIWVLLTLWKWCKVILPLGSECLIRCNQSPINTTGLDRKVNWQAPSWICFDQHRRHKHYLKPFLSEASRKMVCWNFGFTTLRCVQIGAVCVVCVQCWCCVPLPLVVCAAESTC